MAMVNFAPIPSEPLSVVPAELSTDQQYLFRMYEAASIGSVSESLVGTLVESLVVGTCMGW